MQKLLKEPLVHFLIIGLAIFGIYKLTNSDKQSEDIITIDQAEVDYLTSVWESQWNRKPNEEELAAIIDKYIKEELYYKEALALNLDHNDVIVKRRMAQKMQNVASDLSKFMDPATDEQLRKYYEEHPDKFTRSSEFAFEQVLFTPNEHNVELEIQEELRALKNGEDIPDNRKYKLSVKNNWSLTPTQKLDYNFGMGFAESLEDLPLNEWTGPINSGFGYHLVKINDKSPGAIVPFEEIKEYVKQEYDYASELEMEEEMTENLLKKYPVRITAENATSTLVKNAKK